MGWREIVKILPMVDGPALKKMEALLNSRFVKLAKGFGKGLLAAVAGGGIVGIALGIVDKLLSPLKEVNEAIDKTLKRGDDLVTNAKQFNTTAGKLAKLQAFGQASGLSPELLDTLIAKFQTAVAEAGADPSKPSAVRQFVGEKDTAEAFFKFIQELQKLDTGKQVLVQQEVFGEKMILKMSDFLNADFKDLDKFFANINIMDLTDKVNNLGNLKDLEDKKNALRDINDLETKSRLINTGTIDARAAAADRKLELENKQLAAYDHLAKTDAAVEELLNTAKEMLLKINAALVSLTEFAANSKKVSLAPMFRDVFTKKGPGF